MFAGTLSIAGCFRRGEGGVSGCVGDGYGGIGICGCDGGGGGDGGICGCVEGGCGGVGGVGGVMVVVCESLTVLW